MNITKFTALSNFNALDNSPPYPLSLNTSLGSGLSSAISPGESDVIRPRGLG